MGCDIHPAIEVRRKGVWRYHRPTTTCAWYFDTWTAADAERVNKNIEEQALPMRYMVKAGDRKNPWDRCKTRLPDFFTDRNYDLFAILADVRNGGEIEPISSPRGLPHDISKDALAKMSDEHSATWVSLTELITYNVQRPLAEEGIISESQFLRCLWTGEPPSSWSGGVWGGKTTVITPEDYIALFGGDGKERTYDHEASYFINHRWTVLLADRVPQIDQMIKYLRPLVPKGGSTDDVRIVMDFDS
jgi:hypothetical protein